MKGSKRAGTKGPAKEGGRRPRRNPAFASYALAALLLVITVAFVYAPVAKYPFVSLDDPHYITGRTEGGLTADNIQWAFSELYFGYYIPFTLLSHMLDFQIFGGWPGGHHLTSALLHLANSLLLLAFLRRITKAPVRSFIVAALFALHPLHVESVAWIAERKDVLSTFFEFLALLAYARYAEKPSALRYAAVFALFLLALGSKPMVVTFPFLLLLLDYWPLERLAPGTAPDGGSGDRRSAWCKLILEKVPLFALIPLAAWLTVTGQRAVKALSTDERLPLSVRLANAVLSYSRYIVKMFAPSELSAYVPHTQRIVFAPLVIVACLLLLALTAAALRFGRSAKYLPVGWFWYVGGLVPVIGLVQVGLQGSADRYTYVPIVGLFIAVVWGLHEASVRFFPEGINLAALAAALALVALSVLARSQVTTWQSNEVLYRRILAYYPNCVIADLNLGCELGRQGRFEEAVGYFKDASHLTKDIPVEIKTNWGAFLCKLKRYDEAEPILQEAVSADATLGFAQYNLGFALSQLQRHTEALPHYERALALKGATAADLVWIGDVYRKGGLCEEACRVYRIIPATDPAYFKAKVGVVAC